MKVINRTKLRMHREMKGYTQRELAALAGCTQQTISLLESGGMGSLSPALAMKIMKKLKPDNPQAAFSWEDIFELEEDEAMPEVTTAQPVKRRPRSQTVAAA